MKTKILLNGVGRIGKAILKIILENKNFEIIAINGIKDIKRQRNPSCSVKLIYSKRNMNPLHSR